MKTRKIGTTDIEASVVALGTWAVGGGTWWGDSDDQQSVKAIHAAIDAGVNLIDTAPVYGWGRSEEVVGKAIHDRRRKRSYLLQNAASGGTMILERPSLRWKAVL